MVKRSSSLIYAVKMNLVEALEKMPERTIGEMLRVVFDGQASEAFRDSATILNCFDKMSPVSLARKVGEQLSGGDRGLGNYLAHDTATFIGMEPIRDIAGARVGIIGGGIAGIIVAQKLRRNGADVTLIDEKNGPGGVWNQKNSWPGARVDIGGMSYWPASFGEHQFRDIFPTQEELQSAIRRQILQLENDVKFLFSTKVESAKLSKGAQWSVLTRSEKGHAELFFDWLVVATGKQVRPRHSTNDLKFIPGHVRLGDSVGQVLDPNTAKSIAVVGNGASGLQIASEAHRRGFNVSVIQREPHYIRNIPFLRYGEPQHQKQLRKHVRNFSSVLRAVYIKQSESGDLERVRIQQQNADNGKSLNDQLREELVSSMVTNFSGTGLQGKDIIPTYPAGAKRILIDDGSYSDIFRHGGRLYTSPNSEAKSGGVELSNGTFVKSDITIWATGWAESLPPEGLSITAEGLDLSSAWKDRPGAHLNLMDHRFPNLFFVGGPHSNVVVHGSNTHVMELQADFLIDIIRESMAKGWSVVHPKTESQARWQKTVNSENSRMTWGAKSVKSWYKHDDGFVAHNLPFSLANYRSMMQNARWEDFNHS